MNPTEFLLARIAEDEAEERRLQDEPELADPYAEQAPQHSINWRILAECEAKRRIVELHKRKLDLEGCDNCHAEFQVTAMGFPCPTIEALLTVYADHPDHRAEWGV